MGKRARKTRWRTLDIADDHSDSEESNTNSSAVSSRNSRSFSNGSYSKYSYSSQSTPARRRYNQYDGSAKSTRSSSTTSENKITFNEDEYTRITTPRQDVLFKKGYLNKPKNYQTQTSTGNSTVSTGNSTENGTPDHQSTDLDYESQFMFPNGFVDQNGIYYVNSYEPYPLMLFNPPTYYHECSSIKSKRMSIGSLSESMSPNTEEATSQDLSPSGGDASNSVSDYSGGPPIYNMVFPGYYVNGACTPTDLTNGHHLLQEPVKKLRKRRERQSSKNILEDSSEYTDENSGDENPESSSHPHTDSGTKLTDIDCPVNSASTLEELSSTVLHTGQDCSQNEAEVSNTQEELKTVCENLNNNENTLEKGCNDAKTGLNDDKPDFDHAQPSSDCTTTSILKPDAEEFVPRSYLNLRPPPHFKMLPPNFLPIPLVPINDFGGQSFAPHPAFISSGIPINFIPHHPGQKIFPDAPGFANFAPPMIHEAKIEENVDKNEETINDEEEKQSITTPSHTPTVEESKTVVHSKTIDIATVVSKLEAVKQQEKKANVPKEENPTMVVNESKPFIGSPRFKRPPVFKRNYYNKYRNSPIRTAEASSQVQNGDSSPQIQESSDRFKNPFVTNCSVLSQKESNSESLNQRYLPQDYVEAPQQVQNGHPDSSNCKNSPASHVKVQNDHCNPSNSFSLPVRHVEPVKSVQNSLAAEKPIEYDINHFNKNPSKNLVNLPKINESKQVWNSPEGIKKNWKSSGYQNSYQNHSSRLSHNQQNYPKHIVNGFEKPHVTGALNSPINKNYSETLKRAQIVSVVPSAHPKKHINIEQLLKTAENCADEPPKSDLGKPKSNQWISVSSRKKKKNKSTEETEFDGDQDLPSESVQSGNVSSDFENYDVSQLVDVVPTSQVQLSAEPGKHIEDILTVIAQSESLEVLANRQHTPTEIKIPEVSDIEKDIIVRIEEQKVILLEEKPDESLTLDFPSEEKKNDIITNKESMLQINDDQNEDTSKPKKKCKKGTQKPLTKKVIITDIDLSMTVCEVKTPVKKVVTKVEEAKSESKVVIVPEETIVAKQITPEASSEPTEKKPKKKKKNKTSKSIQNENLSGSNATLNITDNSYEFFTENSPLSEDTEKTNDDISLELEKLIQKGMYSSLQEKIKSINVEPEGDGFFKNFQPVPPSMKEKTTTNGFMKTPDFNRIFQSTRQFLKPNMVSLENDNTDIKVAVDDIHNNDSKPSSSATDAADSSSGLTLDKAKVQVQEIQEATTEVTIEPNAPAKENEGQEDSKKLYPITQAVKEWMSKTREATPEVEILKSPSTIQREFGDNGNPKCDLRDPLDSDDEDEVILFSTDDTLSQEQPDFLEYWEHDVANPEAISKDCEKSDDNISNCSKVCSGDKSCAKCQNNSIQDGEGEIEVYESKYGQNDALLKLHRELKEKQANESKHQSLPHRTVCCSLQ